MKASPDSASSEELIAAAATAEGPAPLAVIRVSGSGTWRTVCRVVRDPIELSPRVPVEVALQWQPAESPTPAIVVPFAAHGSYTGEESAEIYLPGSPPLTRRFLEHLRSLGVRAAEPGEFTRRAFLSGRIDLTRAESVSQLIAAESRDEAAAVRRVLDGALAEEIVTLGDELHDLVALLEAGLDFAEQEVEPPSRAWLVEQVTALADRVDALVGSPLTEVREAARVRFLLCGRANAGKSTLFNALLERDAAITSSSPGTTRDPVTAVMDVAGTAIELVDLAGARSDAGAVELEATEIGDRLLEPGDTVLYLFDVARGPGAIESEWRSVVKGGGEIFRWPVLNKIDTVEAAFPRPSIAGCVEISAERGHGVGALREKLHEHVHRGEWRSRGAGYLFTERQVGRLREARRILTELASPPGPDEPAEPELVVVDLRRAHQCLAETTGEISTEATLDRIFQRFCLGK